MLLVQNLDKGYPSVVDKMTKWLIFFRPLVWKQTNNEIAKPRYGSRFYLYLPNTTWQPNDTFHVQYLFKKCYLQITINIDWCHTCSLNFVVFLHFLLLFICLFNCLFVHSGYYIIISNTKTKQKFHWNLRLNTLRDLKSSKI